MKLKLYIENIAFGGFVVQRRLTKYQPFKCKIDDWLYSHFSRGININNSQIEMERLTPKNRRMVYTDRQIDEI